MRPEAVKSILKGLYPYGPVMFLLGPSGIGKTDIVHEVGREHGFISFNEWQTEKVRRENRVTEITNSKDKTTQEKDAAIGALMDMPIAKGMVYPMSMLLNDEVAFHGMPDLTSDGRFMVWKAPQELPIVGNNLFPEKGIWFLDEFNTARRGLQTLGYQIALERRIGNFMLKPGWQVVMAGNRQEDKGEIHEVPGPLKNRLMRIYVDIHFGDWYEWASKNGVDERITSYNAWKVSGDMTVCSSMDDKNANPVGLLWQYDPTRVGWNWPTPRAWSINVNYLINTGILNQSRGVAVEAIGGCIGEGAANDFMDYIAVFRNIPNLDDLLAGKVKFPSIQQPALCYATAVSLGNYAIKDDSRLEDLAKTLIRKDMPLEFGMLIMMNAKGKMMKLTATSVWEQLREMFSVAFKGSPI